MKTSLTMIGFILYFTGAIFLVVGSLVLLLAPEFYTVVLSLSIGVITMRLGHIILHKCATIHLAGQRRPHITHRLAK